MAAEPLDVTALERIPAPDPETFLRRHLRPGRPVVLTGVTDGWAPPREWTLANVAERYGAAPVIAARLTDGTLAGDGVAFQKVPLGELVASFALPGSASHYVMTPTWNLPERFRRDHRLPVYCEDAWHLRAKFWVGKAGTVTPMHRDVPHNLNVHLTGRKRWLLYPPGGAGMYSRGIFSGMPNFSSVDPEAPDDERYPRFRGKRAVGGVVGEGETLFIPHGWWHHTRALDDTVAVNFWWGGPLVAAFALASAIFKRLRGIRHGEWG
ncbi:MAG: cupin-like domain-containing protein [Deltaproteobacteria bacterium]|nr:cupin-like domain-containing protein [Deltaproteobacteria bacterium]